MREPVKKSPPPQSVQAQKSPPVQQKHVRESPPVRQDDVQEGGDTLGHHEVADRDQEVHCADEGDAVPVQESGGDDAAHVPVDQGPGVRDGDAQEGGQDRPRRSPKPTPKYSQEVYDLSYIGVRKRSRKSIRRADK